MFGGLCSGQKDFFDAWGTGRGKLAGHRIDVLDDHRSGLDKVLHPLVFDRHLHHIQPNRQRRSRPLFFFPK